MGKRVICLLLALLLLPCICACQKEAPTIEQPINFYYHCANPEEGLATDVIAVHVVEGAQFDGELIWILNHYVSYTPAEGFVKTFPKNCHVLSLKQYDSYVDIVMGKEFAELSGINLTIAATCIARTVADLTGIRRINLSVSDGMLDGQAILSINLDNLVTLDPYQTEPEGR